jgi:hypothetical protein
MTINLGEALVGAGLLTRDSLESVLRQPARKGDELADRLVDGGFLVEVTLLRHLAAERRTRYVTSEKLAIAHIDAWLLELIPVRAAEACCVLPLRWDPKRKTLSVVMAEPLLASKLRSLTSLDAVEQIEAFVGMPRVIRAGIRRHYDGDLTAFFDAIAPSIESPRAREALPLGAEQESPSTAQAKAPGRPRLNTERTTERILRRPPTAAGAAAMGATQPFSAALREDSVVVLTASAKGVALLSTFEASVLSHVDGRKTVAQLASAARLTHVEVVTLLVSLEERHLVEVRYPERDGKPHLRPNLTVSHDGRARTRPELPAMSS